MREYGGGEGGWGGRGDPSRHPDRYPTSSHPGN